MPRSAPRRRNARLVFIGILLSICPWPASEPAADTVSREAVEALEAYAAFKMARYEEAYRRFLELARKDNVQGMLNVANMHQAGLGVARDESAALDWYRKAAARGSAIGMFYTGEAYLHGYGTAADRELALEWLRKAAVAGSSEAQFELGKLLRLEGDDDEATAWIRRAADSGDSLAAAYLDGLGDENIGDSAIDPDARSLIEDAWAAIDRALVNRNAAGGVHYLAHEADIRVRLPGARDWTPMTKKELQEFWRYNFGRAREYAMSRGPKSYRVREDGILVESVIAETIELADGVESLRLHESALVRIERKRVEIERLRLVIERL